MLVCTLIRTVVRFKRPPEIILMSATSPLKRDYLFQEIPRKIQIWFRWALGLFMLGAICPDGFTAVSSTQFAFKFLDVGLKLAAIGTFVMGFKSLLKHKGLSNVFLILAPLTIFGLIIVFLIPPKSHDEP